MRKVSLKELDNVSRVVLIVLVVVIGYFLVFLILSSIFASPQTPMMQMMGDMVGRGSTTSSIIWNLVSFAFALGLGLFASSYLFGVKPEDKSYAVLRTALRDDERRILDEVKRAGEITQDSLRFRLDWSKSKVSTILTGLDKRNLIQRERMGRTYKVYLQPHGSERFKGQDTSPG